MRSFDWLVLDLVLTLIMGITMHAVWGSWAVTGFVVAACLVVVFWNLRDSMQKQRDRKPRAEQHEPPGFRESEKLI